MIMFVIHFQNICLNDIDFLYGPKSKDQEVRTCFVSTCFWQEKVKNNVIEHFRKKSELQFAIK